MMPEQPCAHPLSRRDAAALIGVLSRLQALVAGGALDEQDVDAFSRRLVRDCAVTAGEDVPGRSAA